MSKTAPFNTLSSLLKRINRHYPYLTVEAFSKEDSQLDPKCAHLEVSLGTTEVSWGFYDWTWIDLNDEIVEDAIDEQTVSGAFKAFQTMLLVTGGKLAEEDEE